jgi:DNA-binding LacI/PurR family transcriptional regulator
VEIPTQLSVIGFDDLPMARWVGPPLTTIRQPLMEMAATAARLVLGLGEEQRIELATTLVVRQSTAAEGGDHHGEVGAGPDRRRSSGGGGMRK